LCCKRQFDLFFPRRREKRRGRIKRRKGRKRREEARRNLVG
jgi:hypothetical protein